MTDTTGPGIGLVLETPDIETEATRLETLGAQRVQDDQIHERGSTWILMSDPEGNEFCVCDSAGAPDVRARVRNVHERLGLGS